LSYQANWELVVKLVRNIPTSKRHIVIVSVALLFQSSLLF